MNNEIVKISVEDKYSVVQMASESLFPHPFTFGNFGTAVADLVKQWEFLWDFRANNGRIYNDIKDAYEEANGWYSNRQVVLAHPENFDEINYLLDSETTKIIKMRPKVLPIHEFNLSAFADGGGSELVHLTDYDLDTVAPRFFGSDYHNTIDSLGFSNNIEESEQFEEQLFEELGYNEPEEFDFGDETSDEFHNLIQKERSRSLNRFLRSIGSNSLLTELAIVLEHERVKVIPYHSYSLHNTPIPRDRMVLLRPGRKSSRYWRRFKRDILALEALLNERNPKERDLEMLLRRNPLFLRGLNYRKVYPQVILPLDANNSLRPDVIAEPVDSDWCHIIDYKLPSQKVLVGRENRLSLASGIIEVASQLREYSAYFDDRTIAKHVEEKYGFKCYKPKLVAIVGRDPQDFDPEQIRRAMTAFPDLEIVTYDRLLKAAKRYLLL